MIVNLKKILIYGVKKQMDGFFEAAQNKGFIQFIGKERKIKGYENNIKDFVDAIKILKKQPKQPDIDEKESSKAIIEKILSLSQTLEKLFEEKRLVESEIMRILPFGDFSKEKLLDLEKQIHRYFQFFTIKKSKREKFKIPQELIYINSAYDLDYFIAINKEKKSYPKMIEIFIETSLQDLNQRKIIVGQEIVKIQNEIKKLAGFLKFLIKELIKELNFANLEKAKNNVSYPIEESIFAIQAWVPENKIKNLKMFTKDLDINFVEIAIEKKDKIPTCLENKKNPKVGEDIIKVYDIPSVKDKDPSMWVLIFFAIFFAIIVSDAGYGFIYLIFAFILKFIFKEPKPLLKRFIKLVFILSSACIFWGILTGSFFGKGPTPESSLNGYVILNRLVEKKATYHIEKKDDVYQSYKDKYPQVQEAKTANEFLLKTKKQEEGITKYEAFDVFKDNILMEFSLFIGVLHISLSFLRNIKRNFAGIGWIIFMIGGYLYFPSNLNATSFVHFLNIFDKQTSFLIGKILLFSGIGISVLLGVIQKKLQGFMQITHIIQVFADVLSYLRLYALGLAGMIMAVTFNNHLGIPMNVFLGFIVMLIGQIINLVLCVMGGIIHGLRLNFIEWYHYSFEGDGKLFDPLRLLK